MALPADTEEDDEEPGAESPPPLLPMRRANGPLTSPPLFKKPSEGQASRAGAQASELCQQRRRWTEPLPSTQEVRLH